MKIKGPSGGAIKPHMAKSKTTIYGLARGLDPNQASNQRAQDRSCQRANQSRAALCHARRALDRAIHPTGNKTGKAIKLFRLAHHLVAVTTRLTSAHAVAGASKSTSFTCLLIAVTIISASLLRSYVTQKPTVTARIQSLTTNMELQTLLTLYTILLLQILLFVLVCHKAIKRYRKNVYVPQQDII